MESNRLARNLQKKYWCLAKFRIDIMQGVREALEKKELHEWMFVIAKGNIT